jgi:hypothetical protein
MLVATILALSLAILTFLFHYAVLRWLSGGMARIAMTAGVVSRMLWKFPGGMLRAWEGSCSQAARSRGIGSMG